jgi:hypothetical protein
MVGVFIAAGVNTPYARIAAKAAARQCHRRRKFRILRQSSSLQLHAPAYVPLAQALRADIALQRIACGGKASGPLSAGDGDRASSRGCG